MESNENTLDDLNWVNLACISKSVWCPMGCILHEQGQCSLKFSTFFQIQRLNGEKIQSVIDKGNWWCYGNSKWIVLFINFEFCAVAKIV